VTFPTPIYHVVVDGSGAMSCSGSTFGSVKAVTTHGDTVPVSFVNYNPDTCGDDDVGCCIRATVPTDSAIASLVIFEAQPADWTLPPPYNIPGHNTMTYYINFDHWRRCPPVIDTLHDAYINDPKLRAGMTEAWANSSPDTSSANRRERGGFLYRDPIGDTTFYVLTPSALDTPCTSDIQPTIPPPISWAVAEFHTHPFQNGETIPKVAGCDTSSAPSTAKYDAVSHGGPSFVPPNEGDWPRSIDDGLPMYIMDKLNIYETDTTKHNRSQWGPGSAKKWTRMTGSCFLF
jgi:hypothetical protein